MDHINNKNTLISLPHYIFSCIRNNKDDLPCELCEQLVGHLRDLLVANTTEEEFRRVMEGLCRQTGTFKEECLSLVDQYYTQLYDFLTSQLNSSAICMMTGICPSNLEDVSNIIQNAHIYKDLHQINILKNVLCC